MPILIARDQRVFLSFPQTWEEKENEKTWTLSDSSRFFRIQRKHWNRSNSKTKRNNRQARLADFWFRWWSHGIFQYEMWWIFRVLPVGCREKTVTGKTIFSVTGGHVAVNAFLNDKTLISYSPSLLQIYYCSRFGSPLFQKYHCLNETGRQRFNSREWYAFKFKIWTDCVSENSISTS